MKLFGVCWLLELDWLTVDFCYLSINAVHRQLCIPLDPIIKPEIMAHLQVFVLPVEAMIP